MTDRYEKIDRAEYWFHDGLKVIDPPDFVTAVEVDMQATQEIIARLRQQGIKATYTHVVVRAAALVLARHPELNRITYRKQSVYLDAVDIGLSVSTDLTLTVPPTLVVRNVDQKSLVPLAQEIIQRVPEVRAKEEERTIMLRKLTRVFSMSWMRKMFLRRMMTHPATLKEKLGTFHITCVPHLIQAATFKSPTAALTFARVQDRVVVRNGQPTVRPMAMVSFTGSDHVWNGNRVSIFLDEFTTILEKGELAAEIPAVEAAVAAR